MSELIITKWIFHYVNSLLCCRTIIKENVLIINQLSDVIVINFNMLSYGMINEIFHHFESTLIVVEKWG